MKVGNYRKKPIVVQAARLTEVNFSDVLEWCGGTRVKQSRYTGVKHLIKIHTLEGDMHAEVGDYIICGVKGEYYPCKPDIFEATYDEEDIRRV